MREKLSQPILSKTFAKFFLACSISISTLLIQPAVYANESLASASPGNSSVKTNIYSQFKPTPSRSTRLDFERMDLLLNGSVLFTGPSLRVPARKPQAYVGTRFIKKHTSPYRLEGNKIVYSLFTRSQKALIQDYLTELEKLPSELDITQFSKNDQLSYWLNIHNLALINEIAKFYPIRYPKTIKPIKGSKDRLHDAKILTINGAQLSLRDIRENIGYKNWDNPIVIYGFHDGTLGSPSLSAIAFERDTVKRLLRENAVEFTNSLRGFRENKISPFYKDIAPFYFKNFESDIQSHFQKFMRSEVFAEFQSVQTLKFHSEIDVISDTTGGYGKSALGANVYSDGRLGSFGLPLATSEYIEERNTKMLKLKERGLFSSGTVIIEDIETEDSSEEID